MNFAEHDLTQDQFLGGRLTICQPRKGYRAGVDPVLLAAATPAKSGQLVLELGCGAGVASLCLAARVSGLSLTGVELQPEYAALARRNAQNLGAKMQVITADLRALPSELKQQCFDHVIANPPYYQRERGTAAPVVGRDVALAGDTPLQDWVNVAARRLYPKGMLTLIQDMRRLPDLMAALNYSDLGSLELLPIAARVGRAPHLLLLRARKCGKADFVHHAPLIMHQGERHERDGESYTPRITAVLRGGEPLEFQSPNTKL